MPSRASDHRADRKISAAADTDGDGEAEGVDEGDPAHAGTLDQRSRAADRKVKRAAGGNQPSRPALVKAMPTGGERNPPGSAERRASAYHEAGHAVASFALDSLLHAYGWPFRIGVCGLHIFSAEDAEGMIARIDMVNRQRDRTWALNCAADDPRLSLMIRDAQLEVLEILSGPFAQMRHEEGGFAAAWSRSDLDDFREAAMTGGRPAEWDESKVWDLLGFIQRHTGQDAADVLGDLEEVTWTLLAAEWRRWRGWRRPWTNGAMSEAGLPTDCGPQPGFRLSGVTTRQSPSAPPERAC
jgi:hypothetical protein